MFSDVQKLANQSLAWSMMPLEQWALWTDSSRKTLDTWVSKSLHQQDQLLGLIKQAAPVELDRWVAPTAQLALSEAPSPVQDEPVVTAEADDLTRISGVGPALAKKLAGAGYTTFAQIAALSDDQIAELEANVIRFSGRITRDNWLSQAEALINEG